MVGLHRQTSRLEGSIGEQTLTLQQAFQESIQTLRDDLLKALERIEAKLP